MTKNKGKKSEGKVGTVDEQVQEIYQAVRHQKEQLFYHIKSLVGFSCILSQEKSTCWCGTEEMSCVASLLPSSNYISCFL